jgi:hypothetical protein
LVRSVSRETDYLPSLPFVGTALTICPRLAYVHYNDPGLSDLPIEPLFANIHDDPRWLPFLEGLGKSPAQLDATEFEVKLPDQGVSVPSK